jgi:hypothetical protein
VSEYWGVNVRHALSHQMWAPAGEAYSQKRGWRFCERIAATTLGGLAIGTDGL